MQQFLKPARGAAWARVVAPKFLDQLFVAPYEAIAALDARFRREAPAAFTGDLESRTGRGDWSSCPWCTSTAVR